MVTWTWQTWKSDFSTPFVRVLHLPKPQESIKKESSRDVIIALLLVLFWVIVLYKFVFKRIPGSCTCQKSLAIISQYAYIMIWMWNVPHRLVFLYTCYLAGDAALRDWKTLKKWGWVAGSRSFICPGNTVSLAPSCKVYSFLVWLLYKEFYHRLLPPQNKPSCHVGHNGLHTLEHCKPT